MAVGPIGVDLAVVMHLAGKDTNSRQGPAQTLPHEERGPVDAEATSSGGGNVTLENAQV